MTGRKPLEPEEININSVTEAIQNGHFDRLANVPPEDLRIISSKMNGEMTFSYRNRKIVGKSDAQPVTPPEPPKAEAPAPTPLMIDPSPAAIAASALARDVDASGAKVETLGSESVLATDPKQETK